MGELGSTYNGLSGKSKKDFGYGDAKYITYMNVYSNPLATLTELDNISIDERQNKVLSGDVLFTTSSETPEEVGMSSVWRFNESNIYLNSFCFGYRPIETFDLNFLAYMLRSNSVRNRIILLAQGISRYNISKKAMMEIEILFPSIKEQTAIGNFFKQLDDTIALHRRNCIKFQNLKTAYLENIFSAKYIQNKDKNKNAWEQRKLGEVGYCQSGIGFPEGEQGRKKGIPFYKVSDMTLIGNELIMVTSNNYVSEEQILKNRWKVINSIPAIIFAKVGAALLLDRKRLVLNSFLIDNNTMAYILNEQWDYYFCKTLFDTIYLPQLSQVGALPSFNGKDVENLNVIIPKSKEEQTAIGNFFKQLDDTIALHQRFWVNNNQFGREYAELF